MGQDEPVAIKITGDPAADAVLEDPFALLIGMLLDQQYPMEQAFRGPAKLLERFGTLDPAAIAAADPERFVELATTTPAIHRFPGSMAAKIQTIAQVITEEYDGQTARLWTEASSANELLRRLQALPGFGKQKAQIFAALLGKRLGIKPEGWESATGDYSLPGYRSVADVVDEASLHEVRAFKKAKKASVSKG